MRYAPDGHQREGANGFVLGQREVAGMVDRRCRVGLILNFFGAYLVRGCDWLDGKLSRRWGARTQAKSAARKLEVDRLRANPHEQVMTGIEALDDKVQGIAYVALGLLLGMIGELGSMNWLRGLVSSASS